MKGFSEKKNEPVICKNCGARVTGKFCGNCGQAVDTSRINYKTFWEDIKVNILGFNGKMSYTTRQMVIRPGHAIREYIEGKRVNYIRPIAFVLATGGAYTILNHFFNLDINIQDPEGITGISKDGLVRADKWMNSHFAWLALLSLPLMTLCSWLLFKKLKYNFTEHLTINSFLLGQRFILRILIIPSILLTGISRDGGYYTVALLFIEFILIAWSFIQLYEKEPALKTSFRIFLAYIHYIFLAGLELIALIYLFSL